MNDFHTGVIATDGSLILKVYFKKVYTLTFDLNGGNYNGNGDALIVEAFHGDEIVIPDAPKKMVRNFHTGKDLNIIQETSMK